MPSPPSRGNPLALAVLTCLAERPMHPYEMAHTLKVRAKHESVRLNYGSLYGVVAALERRGLISARETVREGRRPPRTVYEITPEGSSHLREWLAELVMTPVKEFPQFEAALSMLPALAPDEALELLALRAEALEVRLAKLRGVEPSRLGIPRLFVLESEYQACLVAAELEFVRNLERDLRDGSLDGLELWRSFHADRASDEERQP